MSASRESRLAQHPEDIMIRSLRNLIGRRSVPVTRRRPSARPGFDALEDRTAPAILFHPGVSVTLSNNNAGQAAGPVLRNPLVELVFWGNGWNTNQTLQTNVTNAVTYLTQSTYIDRLGQYGIGTGELAGTPVTITNSSPGANFTRANVITMLQSNMGGSIPYHSNWLYMVITQPGSTDPTENYLGLHSTASASGSGSFYYGWTENVGGVGAMDDITTEFSHEYVEAVTDPAGTAWQVNPRNSNNWNEIADGEAQRYTFRVNNYLVQSYFSAEDDAYVVDNGSTYNFLVTPVGTSGAGVLTLQGRSVTVSRVGNGVYAEVDYSTAQFDPGKITGITVNKVNDGAYIFIDQTGPDAPVTVNLNDGAFDSEPVIVSSAAHNLGTIQGAVTVHGGPVTVHGDTGDSLYMYDQNGPSNLGYTITGTSVTRPNMAPITFTGLAASNVYLFGSSGANVYKIIDTVPGFAMNIRGGSSGFNTFNVLGNAGALTIDGNGSSGAVYLGNNGLLTDILQPVTLTNFLAHGTDLFVEDESDPGNRNVTLSGTQLSFGGPAINFAAGSLNYLSLDGGTGVNTYTVNNTPDAPAGIDLVTQGSGDVVNVQGTAGKLNISGRAPNAVTVGNNGLLANILADVTISGTSTTLLSVDDSADTNNRTAQMGTYSSNTSFGQITGLAAGAVRFGYGRVSAVDVHVGSGGVTVNVDNTAPNILTTIDSPVSSNGSAQVNVHGTTGPLVLNIHGASDGVAIGSAAGSLDPIQGPVTINGSGADTLTVNDQGTTTARIFTLDAGTISWGSVGVTASGMANVIVHGGTGDNTFQVESTLAGVRTDLYGNGVYNDYGIGPGGGDLSGINGPVGLHGRPNSINYAVYWDFSGSGGQTYTVTANSVSRGGVAPVTYDNGEMVVVTSVSGGNTVNVLSNAAGDSVYVDVHHGDRVTIGSAAPALGGTLAAIHGTVGVYGNDPAINASVTIDDSGDAGTDARDVTFSQPYISQGSTEINIQGLTADPNTVITYDLSASASVTVLGGAGNTTYHLQNFLANVPLTLDPGGSTNTLDYSAVTGNVYVNLQTGVATDLAGFRNIQNVVGASGGPAARVPGTP